MSKAKDKPEEKTQPPVEKGAYSGRLPYLIEATATITRSIVILTGILVGVISIFSGATLLEAGVRAGAALLCLGVVLALIFWVVAGGSLFPRPVKQMKHPVRPASEPAPAGTVHVDA